MVISPSLKVMEAGDENSLLRYIMRLCPYKVSHVSEAKCVAGYLSSREDILYFKAPLPVCRSRTRWVGFKMTGKVVVVGDLQKYESHYKHQLICKLQNTMSLNSDLAVFYCVRVCERACVHQLFSSQANICCTVIAVRRCIMSLCVSVCVRERQKEKMA